MKRSRRIGSLFIGLLLASIIPGLAAEMVELQLSGKAIRAYRMADLEQAQKQAREAKLPIAWIASSPTVLENNGKIALSNGRGATLHAFYAFSDKAVLVFQDAYAENHQGPAIVDHALHTPDPHYTPPTVVILDPELKQVLATIPYEPDFNRRTQVFQETLAHLGGPP